MKIAANLISKIIQS